MYEQLASSTFNLIPAVLVSRCLSDPARSTKLRVELRILTTPLNDSFITDKQYQ